MGDKRTSKQILFQCDGGVDWSCEVACVLQSLKLQVHFFFFSPTFYTHVHLRPWRHNISWNLGLLCPPPPPPPHPPLHFVLFELVFLPLTSKPPHRREAIQVFVGGLRVAFRTERRADQTLQKAHRGKAIQMQSL